MNESKGIQNHPLERYLFVRKDFIESKKMIYGKKIIFGHTACKYPYLDPYKIGIDTGATYDNYGILTAYEIDSGTFIQNNGVVTSEEDIILRNKCMNPFDLYCYINKNSCRVR